MANTQEMKIESIITKLKKSTINETAKWLREIQPEVPLHPLARKLIRIYTKFQKLYKNKHRKKTAEELKQFLEERFEFPVCTQTTSGSQAHLLTLPGELSRLHIPSTSNILERSVGDQLKTTTDKVKEVEKELEQANRIIDEKNKLVKTLESRLKNKETVLKRERESARYFRKRTKGMQKVGKPELSEEPIHQTLISEPDEIEDLRRQIVELEHRYDILNEDISSDTVELYNKEGREFTFQAQRCVHALLSENVATNRVGNVITEVLKLAGKTADRVPSQTTVRSMNIQRLLIAQKHVAEDLSSKKSTTIETDETSKYGSKYGAFAIRDDEGRPYLVGLRDLATKSAKDTLDVFKEILWDVDKVYYTPTNNITSQNLLFQIRNTMSDRAATELKFNELLEAYREEILPAMTEGWSDLDEELQGKLTRLNNFFCGLHGMVHMAEVVNTTAKEVEALHFEGHEKIPIKDTRFKKMSESGTCRTIRTACNAFAYGGDAKTSCHGRFMSMIGDELKKYGYRSLPLTPYRGNRFNILFHNACVVFLFQKHMIKFLEKDGGVPWVLHDLNITFFLSGCKALGLICKLITSPLWNLIEDPTIHILDMNDRYLQLVNFLADADVEKFMDGQARPFPDVNVKVDALYHALTEPSQYDADCEVFLQSLLPAMAKLAKKLYHDHLPGGRYESASEEVRKLSKGTAKHNKYCESVFAMYDQLLRTRPHISTIAAEASVMFTLNRTAEWLDAKSEEEERHILKDSRKMVKDVVRAFKERQLKIRETKAKQLKEKMEKAEAAKKRALDAKIKNANDIIYWGLIQEEDGVTKALEALNNSDKLQLLKAQIKFRKNVLDQKPSDPKLYSFSTQNHEKKRRQLTVDELAQNVKQLIQESLLNEPKHQEQPMGPKLVRMNVKHRFETDEGPKWWYGRVVSQVRDEHFKDHVSAAFKSSPSLA